MKNLTKVGQLTSDNISPGRRKVKISLALKDGTERLVLILINLFYLSNNSSNLVSLGLQNDIGISYYNNDQILYKLKT